MCQSERGGPQKRSHNAGRVTHDDCSCEYLSEVLPSKGTLGKLLLITLACHFIPCALGSHAEMHRSTGIFRGATDISVSAVSPAANGVLINGPVERAAITTERLLVSSQHPLVDLAAHALPVHSVPLHGDHVPVEEHEHGLSAVRVWNVVGANLVIVAFALFGIFLPRMIKKVFGAKGKSTKAAVLESICTAFAAGGFWGLALVHVLIEAIDMLNSHSFGLTLGPSFMNAAPPLMCAGYFGMLAVEALAAVISHKSAHSHKKFNGNDRNFVVVDAIAASLALTVHNFFEGMVIGMRDSALLVWIACISVCGHKWASSFALVQRMDSHNVPKSIKIAFLTIFVVSLPAGAFVGLPLSTMDGHPIVGILNAISAGILIFVAAECTSDVFSFGHAHDENHAPLRHDAMEVHCEGLVVADVNSEDPLHTHIPDNHNSFELEASLSLLGARLIAVLAGMGLVFGMMCLHMKDPGHVH
eukprot:Protomagalhaensia_sp_Gyna_25__374@NODE_1177_length_2096_cov_348_515800_g935_i0_p1_GENE_NODE_1177_length_2096_cov_348_515800_g935_i0NODE_1177_length_2096_cov_348_515800_g935_i0_p1_ORF_typecomplete_len472_score63_09Zip/PF02535_22/4_2e02Zip/PF02535_22/1_1e28Mntp/PF02659_15/0_71Mntp/PF02659_15/5_5e02Mntp/PF02659_15/1_8e03_NODE_1177_length_2096_cov_348_515800_g935_i06322047